MEIEIKLRIKNADKLREQLKALGAIFKKKFTSIDQYFTAQHRDFMETKECLRIRTLPEKGKSILTYKSPTTEEMRKAKMMWKEEFEVELNNAEDFARILGHLNCSKLATVHKTREEFSFEGFTITVDELKDIGFFMEIEKIGDDVDTAKKRMWEIVESLGFNKDDIETENYRDLVIQALNQGGK